MAPQKGGDLEKKGGKRVGGCRNIGKMKNLTKKRKRGNIKGT